MPRSAIDTGIVDAVMAPEQIPAALLNYVTQPRDARWPHLDGPDLSNQDAMQTVIHLLREQYGIDFSNYKPNTVTRRIERRLMLNQTLDLDAYAERLSHDPEELSALYKDLLIYLSAPAQKKVLSLFLFGLKTRGISVPQAA